MIAASAGAKTEPAIPVSACNSEIEENPGNSGIANDPAVIVSAPTMISARLALVLSTIAPARGLGDDRADTAHRHDETDRRLVPVVGQQQVDREIGAQPVAHVGEEKVDQIQRVRHSARRGDDAVKGARHAASAQTSTPQ